MISGVYLPTSDCALDDFRFHLTVIEGLVNRHHHGPVCVAGDFNAHVGSDGGPRGQGNPNPHGRLLCEMMHNNINDLFFLSLGNAASGPLYTFFREDTVTTTDYVVVDAVHAPLVSTCTTLDLHPLNSSDHLPISLVLSLPNEPNWCLPSPLRLNLRGAVDEVTWLPLPSAQLLTSYT